MDQLNEVDVVAVGGSNDLSRAALENTNKICWTLGRLALLPIGFVRNSFVSSGGVRLRVHSLSVHAFSVEAMRFSCEMKNLTNTSRL